MDYVTRYLSPLGGITLKSDGAALTGLDFDGGEISGTCAAREIPVLEETVRWLDIYFSGRAPDFTPPLSMEGTPFRRAVWKLLLNVPYGRTTTYGELARKLAAEFGLPRMSAQAVGGAVGHNPVAIIVPCHRVIGADGSLTGYAAGLDKKTALLTLEGISVKTQV